MSDPIRQVDPRIQAPRIVGPDRPRPVEKPSEAGSFGQILSDTLRQQGGAEVRFSAHAIDRLREREIQLTPSDHEQIRDAVDRAAAKGSRESLLLKADLALVVNVPNRTVITAVPGNRMKEHVFTNIDSAVLLK